jgi:hypothetical protein
MLVDDLLVVVNGPDPFQDATWDRYVAWSATIPLMPTVMTFSPYQGPKPAQRNRLVRDLQRRGWKDPHIVLLTDSAIVRGIVTAIGWLMPIHSRAHRPENTEAAMDWLSRWGTFDRDAVRAFLREAIVEVGYRPEQRDAWLERHGSPFDDASP